MKKKWTDYITALPYNSVFLHRDEFSDKYNIEKPKLPAAYVLKDDKVKIFLSKKVVDGAADLDELISNIS